MGRRGPGRPKIGTRVTIVLPDDTITALDAVVAADEAASRSEAARVAVQRGLAPHPNPNPANKPVVDGAAE